jgi:hypothetical protein
MDAKKQTVSNKKIKESSQDQSTQCNPEIQSESKPAEALPDLTEKLSKPQKRYLNMQPHFELIYKPISSTDDWKMFATTVSPSLYMPSEELSSELSQLRKETRALALSLEAEKRESAKFNKHQKELQEKVKDL